MSARWGRRYKCSACCGKIGWGNEGKEWVRPWRIPGWGERGSLATRLTRRALSLDVGDRVFVVVAVFFEDPADAAALCPPGLFGAGLGTARLSFEQLRQVL